jgi:hypothetical protein
MDLGGTRDFLRFEEVSDNTTHLGSSGTRRKFTALHIGYKQRGQHSNHHRTGGSDTNHKIQYLVYFISEVLSDSKTRYFHIMKLAYALLIMSCKLSHYFHAHQIEVHTSLTLGEILNNREATRKLLNGSLSYPCTTSSTSQGQQSRLNL